ncbi:MULTISPECIES: DUF4352 domain-containing protein [Robertmurraya]|uniref:DUF4352 domain-containing protein n=1 Tax=Robertmurraya beringensis TaxID=641660 RepID=A0ABV6KUJ4_9BACI
MKKITIAFILLLLIVMTACNNETKLSEAKVTATETATAKQSAKGTTEYAPNPQVPDDRELDEIGEVLSDRKGEITLLNQLTPNETVNLGPIQLVVKEVKTIHLRPDYGMIDYFHVLTHDEEFDFVKVFFEVTNTSNEKVNFGPVALVETSEGEKVTWEKDIYLDELHGVYAPGEKKQGNVGFILENSNIQSFKLLTSDVFDQKENLIQKGQELEFQFNQ